MFDAKGFIHIRVDYLGWGVGSVVQVDGNGMRQKETLSLQGRARLSSLSTQSQCWAWSVVGVHWTHVGRWEKRNKRRCYVRIYESNTCSFYDSLKGWAVKCSVHITWEERYRPQEPLFLNDVLLLTGKEVAAEAHVPRAARVITGEKTLLCLRWVLGNCTDY